MNQPAPKGFLDRTLGSIRSAWREIAETTLPRVPFGGGAAPRPDLPPDDAERMRKQMRECLEGRGGEVSARARAAALGRSFLALDPVGRERFLRLLAVEFDIDRDAVDRAAEALRRARTPPTRLAAEGGLRAALEAPRVRLLTQFNALPEGVKFLVDLRAELLPMARHDPALAGLEADLKALLASWFDVGFLELRRITWKSPALLLEKLIAYEAVHEIRGWDDLKNRLDSDRRCFAFFHPRMPDEPLIFVEVALVKGMSGNIHALLDEAAPLTDPAEADAAIFYSISNAQRGLAGISFGGFLIKRVVDCLAAEFKDLETFATLSPVPGFLGWLEERLGQGEPGLLLPAERKALAAASGGGGGKGALKNLLARPDWHRDAAAAEALRGPLTRLCARYLAREARPNGKALDPVAHFHLSNGARVERINWLADLSARGLRQSAGVMVNYLYELSEIEDNHEAYTGRGKVAASSAVRGLLKG